MQEIPTLDSAFTQRLADQLGVDAAASIRKFDEKVQKGVDEINETERADRAERAAAENTPDRAERARQRALAAVKVNKGIVSHAMELIEDSGMHTGAVPYVAESAINEAEELLRKNGWAPLVLANKRLAMHRTGRLLLALAPLGFRPTNKSKALPELASFLVNCKEEGVYTLHPGTFGLDPNVCLEMLDRDMTNKPIQTLQNIIVYSSMCDVLADRFPRCVSRPAWAFNHMLSEFEGKIFSDPQLDRMMKGWWRRLQRQGIAGIGGQEPTDETKFVHEMKTPLEQRDEYLAQQQGQGANIINAQSEEIEAEEENNNNFSPFNRPGGM